MKIRIAGITPESVVDGPGIRLVIFTQGCCHDCPGCHNPQTHDPDGGYEMDIADIKTVIENTQLIRGVTFSGGEPFLQPEPLIRLAEYIRRLGLNVVCYSGFYFEELLKLGQTNPHVINLLKLIDILIDGPYQEAKRNTRLAFRGSANQRLINVSLSLKLGQVVLWEDPADQKVLLG